MWTLDADRAVPVWLPAPPLRDVMLAFSTRRGGISSAPFDSLNLGRSTEDSAEAVAENRRRLLRSLDLDPDRLVTAGQVHGASVTRVTAPGHAPSCDALVTATPGLTLAVSAADCLPILFSTGDAVGAAHSGWRGTAAGIPAATLRAVCELASVAPHQVTAHLGPCIRSCCYEVGEDVAARFPGRHAVRSGERWRLDIAGAARQQLVDAGLPPDSIHDLGDCTACRPHLYFSHRRDRGRTGRQWGLAMLSSA